MRLLRLHRRKGESRLHKLILNELIKMFKKKSTIVAAVVILIMCVGIQFIIKKTLEADTMYFHNDGEETIEEYKEYALEGLREDEPAYIWQHTYINALDSVGVTVMSDPKCQIIISIMDMYEDEMGFVDSEKVMEVVDSLKSVDFEFRKTLEILAKDEAINETYTKEVLEDAITNKYKYLLDYGVESSQDKTVGVVDRVIMLQQIIENNDEKSNEYIESLKEYKVTKYALDNKIESYVDDNTKSNLYDDITDSQRFWIVLLNSTSVLTVLSICMIVLAGLIVATEYSQGTIKFLLINPVKRGKIITSKYLTILMMSTLLTVVSFVLNIVVCMVINGDASSISMPYITYDAGKVVEYSAVLFYMKQYLLKFVEVVVYATMAFAISSLLKSTAAAVGVGMACMLCGSLVSALLAEFNQDWGRFLIFSNSDLGAVISGNAGYPGMTPAFSVAVIAVYMVVFLLTAYDGFVRREV